MRSKSEKKISVRVTPSMEAQLNALAAALNLDMSDVVRFAVATLHKHAQREGWLPTGAGEQR